MGAAKPTLGHPSRTAAVFAMRAEKLSTEAIAQRLGIEVKTVVALEASARRCREIVAGGDRTVLFPGELRADLAPHAMRRGISVNRLIRTIVETVVDHGLVDAVLDDGGEATDE